LLAIERLEYRLTFAGNGLPNHFDLRDVGGNTYVTEVKDQNRGGSGAWFATVSSVESALLLDTEDEVKQALMRTGALYAGIHAEAAYYREADATYYYPGSLGVDHLVSFVGWDDTKITAADTPGAWLAKNSSGVGFGEDGYFWVSYADTTAGRLAVSFGDVVEGDRYSRIYYYDEFGSVGGMDVAYAMNAFTATDREALQAVQFWTIGDDARYELRVYGSFTDGVPSDLLAQSSGGFAQAGYHTVDLPESVNVQAGESFYVALYLEDNGQGPASVGRLGVQTIDYRLDGYTSGSAASPGQSYYSYDGRRWTDLTEWNPTANFSIKALMGPI
jgi:hypothetical protein